MNTNLILVLLLNVSYTSAPLDNITLFKFQIHELLENFMNNKIRKLSLEAF